jgi:uncharacterized membrane protein YtjA (UPF0391 family)
MMKYDKEDKIIFTIFIIIFVILVVFGTVLQY